MPVIVSIKNAVDREVLTAVGYQTDVIGNDVEGGSSDVDPRGCVGRSQGVRRKETA